MTALAAGIAGVFGLVFGSFGNVVIHRVPEGQSVVAPPSACPTCGTPIAPRDNVPVLSWLWLRGRCRSCAEPISFTYPLVELAGGLLFAATTWWVLEGGAVGVAALPAYLLFSWMLLIVTVIDTRTRRIPNALTYTLTPALAVLLAVAAVTSGEPGRLLRALVAAAAAFVFLLLLAFISPRGMGGGDVKFAAFLGLGLGYVGVGSVVIGLFGAFLLGGVVSIALLALRLRGRKDLLPFGPYLCMGAFFGLLVGERAWSSYLTLLTG